ncbi:MAG: hypothetical protein EXX96DRAFT_627818 [Benjaminiella poitrasii]|nr:MAG: hypothetical protein EXX96DRAFT_627818 [Benjaminiella poitrasii]
MEKADKKKYNQYVSSSLIYDGDTRKKLEILGSIYKVFVFKANDIDSWKTVSEWTLIIKMWANTFEILFEEEDDVSLVWGDTQNEKLKVDLRICLKLHQDYYDIANIEFKKDGDKICTTKEDEAKTIVEGKTILISLCQYYNANINKAKNIKVVIGQFCGLKGVFKQVRLVAPGAYVVEKWGNTIKYPVNEKMVESFAEKLEQLFVFKSNISNAAKSLKDQLLEDDSQFGKIKAFPKLNDDLFIN